ncbi:catalase [Serratia marcescens]|uniref:catalase n=1 Tax=Serratia marcescens TaxID=615 RepID=UPI0013DA402C|nr:catalase [Serratia marcescens]MBH2669114.1 catalase [Serratia marcescens]MBH2674056.1 catalase [Serratia marcescens]MBH3300592.1 catalase [Serratia marcescens]MEB5611002.1 catalase [Serratia marcescens]
MINSYVTNEYKFRFARKTLYIALTSFLLSSSVTAETLTRDNGAPVGDNQNSQTAGSNGPVLLQDVQLLQKLQRFDRERIPERVVHARGTGAFGVFTPTADISDLTVAEVFKMGSTTPVFVRFSSVVHGNHSPETLRDPHGFATKFYTAQGNWDLVGNNFPTFFIRDAIKFPDMVHAFKPDPRTNLDDDSRRFDFFSHVPEATRTLTLLYSNEGTPASYRNMDGNGVHAYKFVNGNGDIHYVKFHWKTLQGIKNLDPAQVEAVQGKDYSHLTQDLVTAINRGDYPKWDLYIQVLKPEDLKNFDFDPLDATKIWPGVPERKIGQMVLNRNPNNVFQQTEQVAMAPSNLVPGIEPSEDKLLQGRLFAYADTQMYRLGANGLSLPINQPRVAVNNGNQDGNLNYGDTQDLGVNYQPSRRYPREELASARYSSAPLSGVTTQSKIQREQNFRQAGELYRSYSAKEKDDLVNSLGTSLASADVESKNIMLSYFYKADKDYGSRLAAVAKGDLAEVKKLADKLSD